MKGISLWQPWASAMAFGSKTIETRHWSTNVRGTIAIHAAKRKNRDELLRLSCFRHWQAAMSQQGDDFFELPFGAIVAVGELVDCRPTDSFSLSEIYAARYAKGFSAAASWNENDMGDFALGRFGWVFKSLRGLKTPIPFKGSQGFFNVPDELFQEVEYA